MKTETLIRIMCALKLIPVKRNSANGGVTNAVHDEGINAEQKVENSIAVYDVFHPVALFHVTLFGISYVSYIFVLYQETVFEEMTAQDWIIDFFKVSSYILPLVAMFLNSDMATKMDTLFYSEFVNNMPYLTMLKHSLVVIVYYTGLLFLEDSMLKNLLDPDNFYKALPLIVLYIYNLLSLSSCFILIEMEIHVARRYLKERIEDLQILHEDIDDAIDMWKTITSSLEFSTLLFFAAQQLLIILAAFVCIADFKKYFYIIPTTMAVTSKGILNAYSVEDVYDLKKKYVKKAHLDAYKEKDLKNLMQMKEKANELAEVGKVTGAGYFELDLTTLTAMLSTTLTYVIILMQMA